MTFASYELRGHKRCGDGTLVRLLQDTNDGSWFIGHDGDPALDPLPMGAFPNAHAARRWADAQFDGGVWTTDADDDGGLPAHPYGGH